MDYETIVEKRRENNRQLLKELGIYNVPQRNEVEKKLAVSTRTPRHSLNGVSKTSKRSLKPSNLVPTRKSSRLVGKEPTYFFEDLEDIDEKYFMKIKKQNPPKEKIKRENVFGAIPDVPVGTWFATRMEASHAGIHRPPVAGIHGDPVLGCYSLALSGGYEDDVDLGDSFIYTGEGGRDLRGTKTNPKNLRTAPQSKDQVLERGNLALSKSVENNFPVRVLRGYKLRSKFAPEEGYRYDGLYRVVEYYSTTGLSGFSVYKFRMERIEDQDPAPWANTSAKEESLDNVASSEKENIPKDGDQLLLSD